MSLDLGQAMRDTMREVIREEVRAAFKEFAGTNLGADAPLTSSQAAVFVGCHANTIAAWKKSGLLPFTGSGKLTRFKRTDLLQALEKLATTPVVEVETAEAFAKRLNSRTR